jgi:hypothetical protein
MSRSQDWDHAQEFDASQCIGLEQSGVELVPPEVAGQLTRKPGTLVAVMMRGHLFALRTTASTGIIASAGQLGTLAGLISAAVATLPGTDQALYVAEYDQARSAWRDRPQPKQRP